MTILERLWCRLGQRCPAPDNDYDNDVRRIEEADARIRLSIREANIELGHARALSTKRWRDNETPQGKGGP